MHVRVCFVGREGCQCVFVMCLNENVTNNCVAHWPGRATAAPEWQWLLGNDQAIMCHRRWVIKPISRPFISGAYFLVSVSCSCSSSTFLLSNSLCITVCLQPFLSAASPCSLLILFEVASLLTVWSKNKNDRELFFFFFLPHFCTALAHPALSHCFVLSVSCSTPVSWQVRLVAPGPGWRGED